MASFKEGQIAYLGVDQYIAKVLAKEKDAKRSWYTRDAWKKAALLWGDSVFIRKIIGTKAHVSAKGHLLEVPTKVLTHESILCIWQIDVGQGDASLIRFPDGRWAAIDLGPGRSGFINSNSGRTAVDFMKWIAFQDNNWMFEGTNKSKTFHFDWLVFSHPDEDHIGAGKDFVSKLSKYWSVGTVYHCGLGRFAGKEAKEFDQSASTQKAKTGFSQLGEITGKSSRKLFVSTLIDSWSDIKKYRSSTSSRSWALAGNYATILKKLYDQKGKSVSKLKRLSHKTDDKELSGGGVNVKVLGPIEEKDASSGKAALRYLDNNKTTGFYNLEKPSLTRNGQSVVLRLDFDEVRILMTGDLNFKSQALLLKKWGEKEFSSHVAKACHHGSDDVSWKFLKAMSPLATMFSSGDQETHVHPRALILGLSGGLGRLMKWKKQKKDGTSEIVKNKFSGFEEESLFTPLLYSTELSRSVRLRTDMKAYVEEHVDDGSKVLNEVKNLKLKGNRKNDRLLPLNRTYVADQLTYGLINVRTDGKTIMMAVMEEGDQSRPSYHIEKFRPSELVEL